MYVTGQFHCRFYLGRFRKLFHFYRNRGDSGNCDGLFPVEIQKELSGHTLSPVFWHENGNPTIVDKTIIHTKSFFMRKAIVAALALLIVVASQAQSRSTNSSSYKTA